MAAAAPSSRTASATCILALLLAGWCLATAVPSGAARCLLQLPGGGDMASKGQQMMTNNAASAASFFVQASASVPDPKSAQQNFQKGLQEAAANAQSCCLPLTDAGGLSDP